MSTRIKSQTYSASKKTVLLLGAGYSARALIPHFLAREYNVLATTRTAEKRERLKVMGATPLRYDCILSAELTVALKQSDIILSSIPPHDEGDPFLNNLPAPIASMAPKTSWAGYLSATSVYGDRQGQWAYEDELLRPLTRRGQNRMGAEIGWLESGLPIHIFRLAGIYGPGRSPFNRLRQSKARAVIKQGHVVNRIHVDDIASAILASINKPDPVSIYNLADGHPAPPQDVINYAADLLDMPRPPQLSHDTAIISDMARSFYSETKRVSPERAKTDLGWSPRYENFRQGLMASLRAENEETQSVWLSGYMIVPTADLSGVKRALPKHIRLSKQEGGCLFFRVWQDEERPCKFHVIERFKSLKAYHRHQARLKTSEWALVSRNAERHYDVIGL